MIQMVLSVCKSKKHGVHVFKTLSLIPCYISTQDYYYSKWKMPSMFVLCQWSRVLLSTLLLSRSLVNEALWLLKDYNQHKIDLVHKLKSALQTGFMVVLSWGEASISYDKVEKQNSWWGGINLHFENFVLADQLQYRRVKTIPT